MDIVLSRILKYLNGCLDNDYMYQIGLFIVSHYTAMEDYDMIRLINEGHFTQEEVLDFCEHLGFHCYEEFQSQLMADYMLRVSQIRARMLGTSANQLLNQLDVSYPKSELIITLEKVSELIFKKKRVIIIGALYPMSIAVDFQTDFITFGKQVIEYHHFDKEFEYSKDDIVLIVSATGRTLEEYVKEGIEQNITDATIILMTQNIKYRQFHHINADYVIQVPGKFDGLQFNYQIMTLFDVLRIYYYQKYYI